MRVIWNPSPFEGLWVRGHSVSDPPHRHKSTPSNFRRTRWEKNYSPLRKDQRMRSWVVGNDATTSYRNLVHGRVNLTDILQKDHRHSPSSI